MNNQDFWLDNDYAQKIVQENKALNETIEEFTSLENDLEEFELLIEMGLEDSSFEDEIV